MRGLHNQITEPLVDRKNTHKQVLILSYFTNEDGMACSHHIDDRLPYLREMGYEPVLLSSICVPRHKDYTHFRVPSLLPSGQRFEFRRILRHRGTDSILWKMRNLILLPLLPLFALERVVCKKDSVWAWLPLALWKARQICRTGGIDLIYSTGGPAVVHEVACHLAREFQVKWLAEVQDPLIHGYCAKNDAELQLLHRVEKQTYEQADRMIFLTEEALKVTEKRVRKTGKGKVIYPGAAIRPVIRESSGDILTMAHFGSLGGVRNLEKLLEGMELAVQREPRILSRLRIDLFGNVGGDDMARLDASPVKKNFTLKGFVPRTDALKIMQRYDVLLLIQGAHDISRETIPSKLYEYLQSGRLVLGLIHKNNELQNMLTSLGHLSVQADNWEGIAAALVGLFDRWQGKEGQALHPSPYTIERAVGELLSL